MSLSDYEWPAVAKVLTGLWPRAFSKMTSEEAATWRRVCDPYAPGDCVRELRALAEAMKFTPRPCELRARLRQSRDRNNRDSLIVERATAGDLDREAIALALPSRATQAAELTDQTAAAIRAMIDCRHAERVYGPDSPTTQLAQDRAKKPSEDFPEGWGWL